MEGQWVMYKAVMPAGWITILQKTGQKVQIHGAHKDPAPGTGEKIRHSAVVRMQMSDQDIPARRVRS